MDHSLASPFDILVSNARNTNSHEDTEALYTAFFALEEWNFVVSRESSFEDANPFVGIIDEKPWIFVFTDGIKAAQYARAAGGFMERDGNAVVIRMKREAGMNYLKAIHEMGAYGIRFNDGEYCWFIDIPGLFRIDDYLLQQFLKRNQSL